MSVEVLLSAMGQTDMTLIEKCNIHSSCIMVNQCDRNETVFEDRDYGTVRMISTTERGLSRSRNMALKSASADVCILCDDDIVYVEGYEHIVESAFNELSDADIIVFNVNSKNTDIRPQEVLFKRVKRIPKYKMYSSVHIAFKRKSIEKAGLSFDTRFGAGSGCYAMGEDSIFFSRAYRSGLKAYVYPAVIADLYSEKSTWQRGYDEKFYYDEGAFLQAAFPYMKYFFSLYYPVKHRKYLKLSPVNCLKWIWRGIDGCKEGKTYNDFAADQKNRTNQKELYERKRK